MERIERHGTSWTDGRAVDREGLDQEYPEEGRIRSSWKPVPRGCEPFARSRKRRTSAHPSASAQRKPREEHHRENETAGDNRVHAAHVSERPRGSERETEHDRERKDDQGAPRDTPERSRIHAGIVGDVLRTVHLGPGQCIAPSDAIGGSQVQEIPERPADLESHVR